MLESFGLSPFTPAFKGFRRAIVGNLSFPKIRPVLIGACHDHHPMAGENSTRCSSDVKSIGDSNPPPAMPGLQNEEKRNQGDGLPVLSETSSPVSSSGLRGRTARKP